MGFPKIAVPLNHPFLDGVFGFSLKSTIYFGVPPWRAGNLHIPWIKMPWCHHGGHLQASRRRLQTALQPAEGLLRRPWRWYKIWWFHGPKPRHFRTGFFRGLQGVQHRHLRWYVSSTRVWIDANLSEFKRISGLMGFWLGISQISVSSTRLILGWSPKTWAFFRRVRATTQEETSPCSRIEIQEFYGQRELGMKLIKDKMGIRNSSHNPSGMTYGDLTNYCAQANHRWRTYQEQMGKRVPSWLVHQQATHQSKDVLFSFLCMLCMFQCMFRIFHFPRHTHTHTKCVCVCVCTSLEFNVDPEKWVLEDDFG